MNEMRRRLSQDNAPAAAIRRRLVHAAPHLRISFGHGSADGQPLVWDSKSAINGHVLIAGPSGTGKTFQLNVMLAALARPGVPHIHVLNVHGDLTLIAAHLPEVSSQPPLDDGNTLRQPAHRLLTTLCIKR